MLLTWNVFLAIAVLQSGFVMIFFLVPVWITYPNMRQLLALVLTKHETEQIQTENFQWWSYYFMWVVHANSSIWPTSFWRHVKFQLGFLLVHLCSLLGSMPATKWNAKDVEVVWLFCQLGYPGSGAPRLPGSACEPGQVDCQRCKTAHQAAWAGTAVTSSFGEYFRIDK